MAAWATSSPATAARLPLPKSHAGLLKSFRIIVLPFVLLRYRDSNGSGLPNARTGYRGPDMPGLCLLTRGEIT